MIKPDNQCLGKITYDTMALASVCAANLNKASRNRMNSYKCAVCGKFHIGHRSKGKQQQDKKPKKVNWEHHPGIHRVDPDQIKNK